MNVAISPVPASCTTLANDLAFQTWSLKASQHLEESSTPKTILDATGEPLIVSRSGARIYWEYSGTKGGSWAYWGAAIVLPASTQPQQGWKHIGV